MTQATARPDLLARPLTAGRAAARTGALVLAARRGGGLPMTILDMRPDPATAQAPDEWADLAQRQRHALWTTHGWTIG